MAGKGRSVCASISYFRRATDQDHTPKISRLHPLLERAQQHDIQRRPARRPPHPVALYRRVRPVRQPGLQRWPVTLRHRAALQGPAGGRRHPHRCRTQGIAPARRPRRALLRHDAGDGAARNRLRRVEPLEPRNAHARRLTGLVVIDPPPTVNCRCWTSLSSSIVDHRRSRSPDLASRREMVVADSVLLLNNHPEPGYSSLCRREYP